MVLGSELECLSRKKRGRRLGRGRDPGCWDYDGDYGEVVYEDRGCREIEMGRNRTSGDLRMDLKGSLVRRGEVEHEEKKRWKGLSGGMGREGEAKLGDRQGRIRNG